MSNFLLEIGLEEMPAHVVTPSLQQLAAKTEKFLQEHQLTYTSLESFATPRRLAIRINGLPEKQADTEEEVKGPAKKIAQDAEGNWSKAALGFVKGQGLTPEDIYFKELKGVEYLYVTKRNVGQQTKDVLLGLTQVITSLTFPITMHWANYDFAYIRPIHWLIALFDEEVLPLQILDVVAGKTTRGHRFLGEETTINAPYEYEAKLLEQFVVVEPSKREEMIVEQIQEFAEENDWAIDLDAGLLEEVNNLVEYPTVFVGNFAEKYLQVPEEVLVTSMKEHQRYFEVRDQHCNLLPHFISVRNGNRVKIENVVKGNEKVLTARLEDAEFFYQEDQRLTIAECVEKLKAVTFHEKIGSMYEKMQRVAVLGEIFGTKVGLSATELKDLARAASIYKFDLVTNMVGEFPELQGIMGEKYALLQGETPAVATAIREHYMPISAEGALPATKVGAVLALADKTDSLLAFFNVGLNPSGSNDPYALRRQAYGILRILEKENWHFPLENLVLDAVEIFNTNLERFGLHFSEDQIELISFVKGRLRQLFAAHDVRHDVIEAIIGGSQGDLSLMMQAASVLKNHLQDENFKPSVEALTRVINLGKKAQEKQNVIDPALFENASEKALYQQVEKIKVQFKKQTLEENYQSLVSLAPFIEEYFNETMVMAPDEKVRNNRLSQLKQIADLAFVLASFDLLNVK